MNSTLRHTIKESIKTAVLGLLFHTLIFCGLSVAADSNKVPEDPKKIPWHISAGTVTFDQKKNLYTARENVVIKGGNTRLEADYVEYSDETKDANAQGNVLLIAGEDSITCNAMKFNLSTQTGIIDKGTIFIQKNNFYISGRHIEKTGESTYMAKEGAVTSCPGPEPDWKITGEDIKVTIEGYGKAKHTVLHAKKLPVLYSPYLIFPAKTKRQTGLLLPRISSSDRKGYEFEQPMFIAISRGADATIYADYMSERGVKLGTEFRYVKDPQTKGTLYFNWLEDKKTDDGTEETADYSFDTTPQRTNQDRYWFTMKHDQAFANGFNARLDLDFVSDEDYLLEFKDGFTGYTATDRYYEKEFARGLDAYDDTTRKNNLAIYKSWDNYNLNIEAIWFDNVDARRHDTTDTTLQTLPKIEFSGIKQPVGDSQFYYSFETKYHSFYRQDTTDTRVNGQRADIYPRFFLPLKLGGIFDFEPFAGARETIWYTDNFTDISGNSDSFRTREIYDIGARLSTKIYNIFEPRNSFADKIKHEIIPKLEYKFIPYVLQEDLPSFDSADRINEANQVTWSLVNSFISKKMTDVPDEEDDRADYNEFAWIKLSQTYDIKKERDNEERPFSDIALETEINPWQYFSLDMDLAWSPYDNILNSFNLGNTITDARGDSLNTEYRYTRDNSESIYSKLDIILTDELTAFCSIEQNLKEKNSVETLAGVSYKKSCWTLDVRFAASGDEKSINVLITLHGIGEFGIK